MEWIGKRRAMRDMTPQSFLGGLPIYTEGVAGGKKATKKKEGGEWDLIGTGLLGEVERMGKGKGENLESAWPGKNTWRNAMKSHGKGEKEKEGASHGQEGK